MSERTLTWRAITSALEAEWNDVREWRFDRGSKFTENFMSDPIGTMKENPIRTAAQTTASGLIITALVAACSAPDQAPTPVLVVPTPTAQPVSPEAVPTIPPASDNATSVAEKTPTTPVEYTGAIFENSGGPSEEIEFTDRVAPITDLPTDLATRLQVVGNQAEGIGYRHQTRNSGPAYFEGPAYPSPIPGPDGNSYSYDPIRSLEVGMPTYTSPESDSEFVQVSLIKEEEGKQYLMGLDKQKGYQFSLVQINEDNSWVVVPRQILHLVPKNQKITVSLADGTATFERSGTLSLLTGELKPTPEAPVTPALTPFEEITDVSQAQELTYEQLMTIESNMDFSDLTNAPLTSATGGISVVGNGSMHIRTKDGIDKNTWFKVESLVNADGQMTYVVRIKGPQGQKIVLNIADPYIDLDQNTQDLNSMRNPRDIYVYMDLSMDAQFDPNFSSPHPRADSIRQLVKDQGLADIFQQLAAARGYIAGNENNFWNILQQQLSRKFVPLKVVYEYEKP